jgi:ABC-type multidrug transport system permease subunit
MFKGLSKVAPATIVADAVFQVELFMVLTFSLLAWMCYTWPVGARYTRGGPREIG